MEVAIAILLALILVAMVSSNKAAADGVWKIVRYALMGGVLFTAWMTLVLYSVWFYAEYPKSDWERIAGIAAVALLPPFLLFINWKTVVKSFQTDRRAAIKYTTIFVAYLVGLMIFMPVYQEMKKGMPYLGWAILLFSMFFTGVVLTWRSMTWPKEQYVWFNEPDRDDPWLVVQNERDAATDAEEALWDKFQEAEDNTAKQREAFANESAARRAATTQRLQELSEKLEAEKADRNKRNNSLNLRSIFWLSFTFACFGLIGVAWDYAFDYAMTVPVIKGREWMATGAVIFCGIAALGLLLAAAEEVSSWRKKHKLLR